MAGLGKNKDWQGVSLPATGGKLAENHGMSRWRQGLVMALFVVLSVGLVSFGLVWQFDDNVLAHQQAGEVALADWLAPKSHSYQSAVKTKELEDAAANRQANRVYKRDSDLVARQRESLQNLLNLLDSARGQGRSTDNLQNDPAVKAAMLSQEQVNSLLTMPASSWQPVEQEAITAFGIEMSRDILPGEESAALTNLRDAVFIPYTISASFAQLSQADRELAVGLVHSFIKSNNVLDEEATQKKRDEARAGVGPATVDIIKGSAIVRRGDILTPLQIEELQELGLRTTGYNIGLVAGTVGLTAVLVLLLVIYCVMLAPQVWTSLRWPAFLLACLVIAAIAMRVLVVGADRDSARPYLLPLAAISMVIAALFDVHLSLFVTAVLALLIGISGGSPELILVFFAGGAAGALAIRRAENTSVFAWAGLSVALSQLLVGLCAGAVQGNLDSMNLWLLTLYCLLNGLISASLAFFCFSVLGKLFGVATVLQLLELAHPNQPLLRRLIREAPGTYHHSILVSNLAEQAAERLSDNALLARVGAYYHDIGKLVRPSYYIDNQAGGANIHDQLDPRESARLIRAHVSDGVALARKHKLPRKVVDIIHQHHGTCMISFFYQKAVKEGLDVTELDFRYPGPKPQTKVAALVMLADGCEAAVRANVQSGRIPTGQSGAVPSALNPDAPTKLLTIREVVDKIIDDRIKDNQLSECDLTLRDVEEVRNLFTEILTSIYHPRIIYPDKDGQPTNQPSTAIVTAVAREVPVALTPLVEVPVPAQAVAVTSGAADSGGDITVIELRSAEATASEPASRPKLSRFRIGGAGRRLDPPKEN